MSKIPKELQPLVDAARDAGWTMRVTKKMHLQMRSPSGETVTTSLHPNDRRAWKNCRARLRQRGVKV